MDHYVWLQQSPALTRVARVMSSGFQMCSSQVYSQLIAFYGLLNDPSPFRNPRSCDQTDEEIFDKMDPQSDFSSLSNHHLGSA